MGVVRQRSFWSTGYCLGKEDRDRTQQWGQGRGLCSDQRAAQDTRGKPAPLHRLPSGQPGVEKRFEMNVFTPPWPCHVAPLPKGVCSWYT